MKKFILSLAVICMAVSSVVLSSCSKDDDEPKSITCTCDFTVQTVDGLDNQYKAAVEAILGVMNAEIVKVNGQEKVEFDAQEVDGKLVPTSASIGTFQSKVMSDAVIQETITQIKNCKDKDGNAAVLHLNFNVYNADDSSVSYYSNAIF